MGHGMDPVQEVGASRGDVQNNRTSAFNPSCVSPCLMVIGTLDLEDFQFPILTTSIVLTMREPDNGELFGCLSPKSYLD
jgi:hypothetical protein